MYRKDRSYFGGGLLFNVNEICGKPTAAQIDFSFENIFLEITFQTRKRLITGLYKPPNQKEYFFKMLVWF